MNAPAKVASPWQRAVRWLLRQIEHCLAVFGLGAIVCFACFDVSRMTSGSMSPTLRGNHWRDGDLVLTERVSYWFRKPRRWEVLTFRNREGVQVMKRVIGLPGEQVRMPRREPISIDGEELKIPPDLSFLHYLSYGNLADGKPVSCGKGYYVLGDDSMDSDDSRFQGAVQPDEVIGRAWLVLAPAGHRRWVNP